MEKINDNGQNLSIDSVDEIRRLAGSCYHYLCQPINKEILEKVYKRGVIRKEDLIDGATYLGYCRNAYVAVWRSKEQLFTYIRTKFGSTFTETIVHPEDDKGYDIFVPIKKL